MSRRAKRELEVSIVLSDGMLTATGLEASQIESEWVRSFDGPFTAPAVSGPVSPPPWLLLAFPLLEHALGTPDPDTPAIRDCSWRAAGPQAAGPVFSHWTDWNQEDAARLETVWTDSSWDYFVRETIELWAWAWPDVVGKEAAVRIPDAVEALRSAHRSDPRFSRKQEAHRNHWVETALHLGLHEFYRYRVVWPDPIALDCAVCGRLFAPETLSHWMRRFGPFRYCAPCCVRAQNGFTGECDPEYVLASVKGLADSLSFIPSTNRTAMSQLVSISNERRRDVAMAALIATPPTQRCAEVVGLPADRGNWLRVLIAAGVVTESWTSPRGTMSIAADGHFCRSLGERSIDDWLFVHGIVHEVEPSWPLHPELNPSALKRADWLLPGDVFVEYAGMLEDSVYAAKMEVKVLLARQFGIDLLILTPSDLPRLDRRLERWLE
jgi:hypothetical protein